MRWFVRGGLFGFGVTGFLFACARGEAASAATLLSVALIAVYLFFEKPEGQR